MRIILTLLLVAVWLVTFSQGQGPESPEDGKRALQNTISVGIGRAHDITSDADISNIGFDYLRRFHPKWEWGIQLDLDWEKNFVEFEGVQMAGIIVYSINSKWPVFGGIGIANEEEGSEGFIRIGTEYTFFLGKNERLFVAPGTFLDTDRHGVTPSILLAMGWLW